MRQAFNISNISKNKEKQVEKNKDFKKFIWLSVLIWSLSFYIFSQESWKNINIENTQNNFSEKIIKIIEKNEKKYLTLEEIDNVLESNPNTKILVNDKEFSLKIFIKMFWEIYKIREVWLQVYYENWVYKYHNSISWINHLAKKNKENFLKHTLSDWTNYIDMSPKGSKEFYKSLFWNEYKPE